MYRRELREEKMNPQLPLPLPGVSQQPCANKKLELRISNVQFP